MFSPTRAENESLKVELSFTQTKIADLETKLKDKEQSLKIYAQKLKLMDERRYDFYQEKYFPDNTNAASTSGVGSECSCQVNAKISRNSSQIHSALVRICDLESKVVSLQAKPSDSMTNSDGPTVLKDSIPSSQTHAQPSSDNNVLPDQIPVARSSSTGLPELSFNSPNCAEDTLSISSSDHESDFNFDTLNNFNLN